MAKLDRLGWAAGLSFRSYGLRLGVRVNQPDVLRSLPDYLPPGWKPAASPVVQGLYSVRIGGEGPRPGLRQYHLVYAGASRVARTLDLEEAFSALHDHLHSMVAAWSPRRVFVEAGVVGWRGQGIVLVGPPGSGRSALAAELVKAGATYYSDQYAVFDRLGRVHPFPRPLLPREGPGAPVPAAPGRAAPGRRTGRRPLPVGLIVASSYRPGARWRPQSLSAGQGLLALLGHAPAARFRPDHALDGLRPVVAQAVMLKGRRGEAAETIGPLLARLNG